MTAVFEDPKRVGKMASRHSSRGILAPATECKHTEPVVDAFVGCCQANPM